MPRLLALFVAAVASVGVWLTWQVFVLTRSGQAVEQAALQGAVFGQTRLWELAEPVLDVVSLGFLALGALTATIIALVRGRAALAIEALVLLGGANLTTQLLKSFVLDRPSLGFGVFGPSLPSGHTTAAASLAAALIIVAPRRARPWLAVGGAIYTAATGVSTLIGQWHRSSDVIAAVLVVLAWASLACALGHPSAADRAPRGGAALGVGVLLLGATLAALPAAWGLAEAYQAATVGAQIRPTATYLAGALGVSAVAAVAFALLLVVRQSTARPVNDSAPDAPAA